MSNNHLHDKYMKPTNQENETKMKSECSLCKKSLGEHTIKKGEYISYIPLEALICPEPSTDVENITKQLIKDYSKTFTDLAKGDKECNPGSALGGGIDGMGVSGAGRDWEEELLKLVWVDKEDWPKLKGFIENLLASQKQELLKKVEGMIRKSGDWDYASRAYNEALEDIKKLIS